MSQTLLLADDSATIQRVIELTFADEDIRVIAVGDGQQAIDRIKASPPDIVLADVSMPERDGYDVATFIKEDPALAHIPVVLLRVAGEPVDEDRARQVGCDRCWSNRSRRGPSSALYGSCLAGGRRRPTAPDTEGTSAVQRGSSGEVLFSSPRLCFCSAGGSRVAPDAERHPTVAIVWK